MAAARIMPEQIHNYAHNNDWLVKNLTYVGRVQEAIDLAKNMIELPRLATGHKLVGKPGYVAERGGFVMGQRRLLDALLAWERWDDLLALDGGASLPVNEDATEETKRLVAMGIAAFQKDDKARGMAKVGAIRGLLAKIRQERTAKGAEAEAAATKAKKPVAEIAKAIADAQASFVPKMAPMEKAIAELELYRALAEGRTEDARKQIAGVTIPQKVRLSRLNELAGDSAKALPARARRREGRRGPGAPARESDRHPVACGQQGGD